MDNSTASGTDTHDPRRRFLIAGIGILAIVLVVAGIYVFSPHRAPLPCEASTLQIGEIKLRIQTLDHAQGASINVPSGKPNLAFWVDGTNAHFVFALSPTAQNLTLDQQIKPGTPIIIRWADCSSDEYVAASVGKPASDAVILDQSRPGMTVFVPARSGSAGWQVEGQRPQPVAQETPEPTDANTTQADISFLDQSVSPDGKTLSLKIDIKNTGTKPIHLTTGDISLAVGDAAPSAPKSVDVTLPLDIQPGASQTLNITFPKAAGSSAIFKLLDFSVELYF